MFNISPILKENSPKLAEGLEHWVDRYGNGFNLETQQGRANFNEALGELSMIIISHNKNASITFTTDNMGISSVNVRC